MNTRIIIESTQNGEKNDIVDKQCSFVETQKNYIVSYLEGVYNNIINIEKETNIVIVEKKSVGGVDEYHSKLVFEFQKKKKCSINTTEYSLFVDINTIKVNVNKNNDYFNVLLKYYINDIYNEVKILIKM